MTDLDISLKPHPVTGDLIVKDEIESIKQSVQTIVKTAFYESLFAPNLGCQVADVLFENLSDPLTEYTIQKSVLFSIRYQEPRAKDVEVLVNVNEADYSVTCDITFTPVQDSRQVTTRVFVERVR